MENMNNKIDNIETEEKNINENKKTNEFETANYKNQLNKFVDEMIAQELDKEVEEITNLYNNKIGIIKNEMYKDHQERLKLIPKYCDYIEYMLNILRFLPRIEKFNIGNDFKSSMYDTLENIVYLDKIEDKNKLFYLNKIDAALNYQRILLRIMVKHNWISVEKFNIVMLQKLSEVGKITGGLVKYYAKNHKK